MQNLRGKLEVNVKKHYLFSVEAPISLRFFLAVKTWKTRLKKWEIIQNWIASLTALSYPYVRKLKIHIENQTEALSVISTLWTWVTIAIALFWLICLTWMILGVLCKVSIWKNSSRYLVGFGKIFDFGILWIICLEMIFLMIITKEPMNVMYMHMSKIILSFLK